MPEKNEKMYAGTPNANIEILSSKIGYEYKYWRRSEEPRHFSIFRTCCASTFPHRQLGSPKTPGWIRPCTPLTLLVDSDAVEAAPTKMANTIVCWG